MTCALTKRPEAGRPGVRAARGLLLTAFFVLRVGTAVFAANSFPEVAAPAPAAAAVSEDGAWLSQRPGRSRSLLDQFPPEERPRMEERYRQFQQLPPDQREQLRQRYEEWNRMSPGERDRYEQRHRQWQQIPPEERRRMEDQLQRWDRLSPQERDSIRRRFRD